MPTTKKMAPKKYPPETIQRAKELFDAGMSGAKIAQELKIPRKMTIYNWIKKYGWERPLDKPLDLNDGQEKIFTLLADKALKYLQSKGFGSMSEAMRVYKDAMGCLELVKKKEASSKKGVLGILEEAGSTKGSEDTESDTTESDTTESDTTEESKKLDEPEKLGEDIEGEEIEDIDIETLVSDQKYQTEG